MALNFNSQGNLHETISLTYDEFIIHFATNSKRKQQMDNAMSFFHIFYKCGCQTVYVDGSFVSTKKYPEDIDLCFDLTDVKIESIEKTFPMFFDPNELGRIHRDLQCHLFYMTRKYTILFNMLQNDRSGNPKGFVKLTLEQILNYDQK